MLWIVIGSRSWPGFIFGSWSKSKMIGSHFLGHDPNRKWSGHSLWVMIQIENDRVTLYGSWSNSENDRVTFLGHDPNLKMIGSGDPVDRSLVKILNQVSGHEKNFITKFQYYLFEIFLKIKKFFNVLFFLWVSIFHKMKTQRF